MQVSLYELMNTVLADPDAALEAGWTPKQWEAAGGFARLARSRIRAVGDLRAVFAALGASDKLVSLRGYEANEPVEIH